MFVITRLQQEIDSNIGAMSVITPREIDNLPYLDMVMKESLRMYPVAKFSSRETAHEHEIGGYKLPAGTDIMVCWYLIYRAIVFIIASLLDIDSACFIIFRLCWDIFYQPIFIYHSQWLVRNERMIFLQYTMSHFDTFHSYNVPFWRFSVTMSHFDTFHRFFWHSVAQMTFDNNINYTPCDITNY